MASLTVRYSRMGPFHSRSLSYGLSVEVSNAVDMTRNIFVIKRSAPSATDPEMQLNDTLDEFNHVATPLDLHEIPDGAPNFDETGSWYRTNYWEFSFRTPDELEDSVNLMRKDIQALVRSVNAEKNLQVYLEEVYE